MIFTRYEQIKTISRNNEQWLSKVFQDNQPNQHLTISILYDVAISSGQQNAVESYIQRQELR